MRKLRVFVDSSVFGGCFDKEFERHSRQFFEEVRSGRFEIVVSQTVLDELDKAPIHVLEYVVELGPEIIVIEIDSDSEALRDAYIEAGIVGKSSFDDAEHIAVASIEKVDLVVSWNFKHLVHFDKVKGYNAINMLKGYPPVDIRSPSEVIEHENKNV